MVTDNVGIQNLSITYVPISVNTANLDEEQSDGGIEVVQIAMLISFLTWLARLSEFEIWNTSVGFLQNYLAGLEEWTC